jgi:hypothetical protein
MLFVCALLAALALASAQHGNGMNSPNGGIDLGALLGGGAGGGGGRGGEQFCSKKGQVMVPKTDYLPAANGCGPTGMRQKNGDRWRLHECCNGHDTCYVRQPCGVRIAAGSATDTSPSCATGGVWRDPHLLREAVQDMHARCK